MIISTIILIIVVITMVISISMSVSEPALSKFREFKHKAKINQHTAMTYILENMDVDAMVKAYGKL